MLPHHSTSKLMRHPDGTYSAEASMLSLGGRYPMFGQVYQDAADEGCVLVSSKTGCELKMVVKQTHRDRENDVQYWELESDPADARRLKLAAPLKLKVFNT